MTSPSSEEREGVEGEVAVDGSERRRKRLLRRPAWRRSAIPISGSVPRPLTAASPQPSSETPPTLMMLTSRPSPSLRRAALAAAANTSIMRTSPPHPACRPRLAVHRGRTTRAASPTTTVSVSTNRPRVKASVGRAYCEVAMARPRPRPLRWHGDPLRAPWRRDLTLGRAPATPALAGSPTIPRPERTPWEQPQRHADAAHRQVRGATSRAAARATDMSPPP